MITYSFIYIILLVQIICIIHEVKKIVDKISQAVSFNLQIL